LSGARGRSYQPPAERVACIFPLSGKIQRHESDFIGAGATGVTFIFFMTCVPRRSSIERRGVVFRLNLSG
jgi:hypothetical protein